MSKFDFWISRIIDNCCVRDPDSSIPLAAFKELVELVADTRATGIAEALQRLGHLRDDEVFGIRLKERSDYPPNVDPSNSRSKMAGRYLTWLLEGQ